MSDTKKAPSQTKVRMKVQELVEKNTRSAVGRFHAKEFNERIFLNDLFKNFILTPKENGDKV